jgi:hypothetical protein
MAENSSKTASENAQPDAFALADKPVQKVSFRQILTQQRKRNEIGDVILLTALMNSLEIGLFYLYHGDTGVWGTIAAIVSWCALSWPNAEIYERFRAWFTYRAKQHERREMLRHRQELADVRLAIERNQQRIPMELLESTEPSRTMREACDHIQALLDALAPVAELGQVSSESIGAIQRIRSEYLAEILGNYMALPPDLRTQPILGDGRTPEAACVEQAKWIVARLQRIRLEYYQRKADRIGASGEFLKSRPDLMLETESGSAANDQQVTGQAPGAGG